MKFSGTQAAREYDALFFQWPRRKTACLPATPADSQPRGPHSHGKRPICASCKRPLLLDEKKRSDTLRERIKQRLGRPLGNRPGGDSRAQARSPGGSPPAAPQIQESGEDTMVMEITRGKAAADSVFCRCLRPVDGAIPEATLDREVMLGLRDFMINEWRNGQNGTGRRRCHLLLRWASGGAEPRGVGVPGQACGAAARAAKRGTPDSPPGPLAKRIYEARA